MTDTRHESLGDVLPKTTSLARALMLTLHEHPNPGLASCVQFLEDALHALDLAMIRSDLAAIVSGYAELANLLRTIALTQRLAR